MSEPKILLDIKKLISSEIGTSKKEKISRKIESVDETKISQLLIGEIKLTNLGENILAEINLKTALKLECSRCAKDYNQNISLNYKQTFRHQAKEDDFPINPNETIDLWPSIRQELIMAMPIKPLCKENCQGIKIIQNVKFKAQNDSSNFKI